MLIIAKDTNRICEVEVFRVYPDDYTERVTKEYFDEEVEFDSQKDAQKFISDLEYNPEIYFDMEVDVEYTYQGRDGLEVDANEVSVYYDIEVSEWEEV